MLVLLIIFLDEWKSDQHKQESYKQYTLSLWSKQEAKEKKN